MGSHAVRKVIYPPYRQTNAPKFVTHHCRTPCDSICHYCRKRQAAQIQPPQIIILK